MSLHRLVLLTAFLILLPVVELIWTGLKAFCVGVAEGVPNWKPALLGVEVAPPKLNEGAGMGVELPIEGAGAGLAPKAGAGLELLAPNENGLLSVVLGLPPKLNVGLGVVEPPKLKPVVLFWFPVWGVPPKLKPVVAGFVAPPKENPVLA